MNYTPTTDRIHSSDYRCNRTGGSLWKETNYSDQITFSISKRDTGFRNLGLVTNDPPLVYIADVVAVAVAGGRTGWMVAPCAALR